MHVRCFAFLSNSRRSRFPSSPSALPAAILAVMRLTITNYLDVISSWCHWAIPAWSELREQYRDRVDFSGRSR